MTYTHVLLLDFAQTIGLAFGFIIIVIGGLYLGYTLGNIVYDKIHKKDTNTKE